MHDADVSTRKPARKLFAQRSSPKKPRRQKRRTQQEINEQKEGPPVQIDVELPAVECNGSSFPSMTVKMLKSTVQVTEHVWVGTNDVCKVMQFIYEHGVTSDMVSTKKAYKRGADRAADTESGLQSAHHEASDVES